MREGDELDRAIARLDRTFAAREHAVRRLRASITRLEAAGKFETLRPWILDQVRRIETAHHNVTESIDRLGGQIETHLRGNMQ